MKYLLSIVTLAVMVVAGLLVKPEQRPRRPADAAQGPGLLETARDATRDVLTAQHPEEESAGAAPRSDISESDAIRIALERGVAIKAAREAGDAAPATTESEPPAEATPEATPDDGPPAWVVTASAVNLRAGPGTGHAVVGQAAEGDRLTPVSDTAAEWIEVTLPSGDRAWIFADFLSPPG